MSNEKTVDDWKRAREAAEANIIQLEKEQETVTAQWLALTPQINKLSTQRNSLPAGSPERIALDQQINELRQQSATLDNRRNQLAQQIVEQDNIVQQSERQADLAQNGPPNTNTTTPPVESEITQSIQVVETQSQPEQLPDTTVARQPVVEVRTQAVIEQEAAAREEIDTASIIRTPAELTDDALQEARFEQERLNALAAQQPTRDPSVPPVITQDAPPGVAGPLDDNGNLQPGWVEGPDGTVAYVGFEASQNAGASLTTASASRGITGEKAAARSSGTANSAAIKNKPDWRVRLQLAPQANYLYKDPRDPGILKPLQATNGVLFPYLPAVTVNYSAQYDAQSLAHTNYKILQYGNSSVDSVQVQGEFTAQTTEEANYLLAVIHFFRTITKMFYGQDQNPKRGTPPPLTYLTGFGEFQYSQHPLVITAFNYSLPTDVDYIRADSSLLVPGTSATPSKDAKGVGNTSVNRIAVGRVPKGGYPLAPQWARPTSTDSTTYVPTKMNISFSGIPVVTRADISRAFSVQDYARGTLTRGKTNVRGRGFW